MNISVLLGIFLASAMLLVAHGQYDEVISEEYFEEPPSHRAIVEDEEEAPSHAWKTVVDKDELSDGDSSGNNDAVSSANATRDLRFHVLFPDYPLHVMPAGLPIRTAIALVNNGADEFILRSVVASLYHSKKANHNVQNFSALPLTLPIHSEPELTTTVLYSFWPHHSYADHSYYLVVFVYLTDNKNNEYFLPVYNRSHTLYDLPTSTFDLQLVVIILILLGGVGLIGYFTYEKYFKNHRSIFKKKDTPTVEVGTRDDGIDYSWLPREITLDFGKSKAKLSSKKSKSS